MSRFRITLGVTAGAPIAGVKLLNHVELDLLYGHEHHLRDALACVRFPAPVAIPAHMNNAARGILWMLLSTALLSCMHGMVRHVSADLHTFEIAFFRNLFGFVAILPMLMREGWAGLSSKQPKLQVLRGATGIIAMLCWFYAPLAVCRVSR